jgi:hypothetical protein
MRLNKAIFSPMDYHSLTMLRGAIFIMKRILNFFLALVIVTGLVLGAAITSEAEEVYPEVKASSYLVGDTATYEITFILTSNYGVTSNDIISVIFPSGYDLTGVDSGDVTVQSGEGSGLWDMVKYS